MPPHSHPFVRLGRSLLFFLPALLGPLHAQRMELADHQAQPVVVESARITTEVTGHLAVTTFDLVFHNPNSRVLEGTLVFPLLDGQSVVRFALDLNGVLREAVPVDKTRGRVVFEQVERRGIDPGLIEQVAGNNYRARIYPIPARGNRHVVIAYQEDLATHAGVSTYRLALDFPGQLKNFHLALSTLANGGPPAQVRTTLPLELPAWREGKFLEIERADFAARGLIELTLPPMERPGVITGRAGDTEYFYVEVPVASAAHPRPAPKTIGLLWDSSGSGRQRDHQREFALLDTWFASVRNVEVRLIRLRDQAEAPQMFSVKQGDWSALKAELVATIYDGATSLDGLADDPAVQEWLLFSDGLVNYGVTSRVDRLPFTGVVHTLLASPTADPAWLKYTARRQGGEFINLLSSSPAEAIARLRSVSPRVLDVEHDAETLAQVFPEAGATITDGQLVVTGILRQPVASLRLRIGHDASDAQVVTLTLHSGENPSALAARAWATAKIAQLSLDLVTNRDDIRRTSGAFGIVTADTSLIVLETLEDYVRYEIAPPSELRAEWDAHRQTTFAAQQKTDSEHLQSVLAMFESKVAWWEKSYPRDPYSPASEAEKRRAGRPEPSSTVIGAAEPAPALTTDEGVQAMSRFQVTADRDNGYLRTNSATATRIGMEVQRAPGAAEYERRMAITGASRGRATDVLRDTSSGSGGFQKNPVAPSIALQAWSPQAGYLDHLRRVPAEKRYGVYLEERPDHERQPGFFLDVANFFFEQHDSAHGLRILSNLAELELEDVPLLRVLAHQLTLADRPDLARPLFERVLVLRPDEPQSYRDLALVCAALGDSQRAVDLLAGIVNKTWDPRFPEIELIALTELNAIAASSGKALDLTHIDPRLRKNLPVATRAILTWDANDCDIDLWVTDPNGEVAKYDHPLTFQGGRMSRDFTQGYGPEEFMLRDPKPGTYRVQINYYGDHRQSSLGPVTAQLRLISGFGTDHQTEKRLTVRLQDNKETLDIGTFEVPGKD